MGGWPLDLKNGLALVVFNRLLRYYEGLRYLSSITILTTTKDQTTHLALVQRPIP